MNRNILLTIVLALTAGCKSTPKNAGPAEDPVVEVDRVFPQPESLEASAVEVTLAISNPTGESIEIAGVEYTIDTKDVGGVLKGKVQGGATVAPQQKSELKFRQSVPFPSDRDQYKTILDRQTLPFELKGTVKLGDGTKLDFEKIGEVATPTLPRFEVNDPQAARYGAEGVDVTMYLRLINDNVFPVLVQNVTFTVWVNDKKVRSETAAVGQRLIAGSAEEYEVSKTITAGKEFPAAEVKAILQSGRLTYKVDGTIEVARLTIPFEHSGTIELATGE
jgi:LEA14-like dessication related protein